MVGVAVLVDCRSQGDRWPLVCSSGIARAVAYGVRMTWPDCEVTIAGSGAEALARFQEERSDLVVLDVQMPPPDGFEVCRRIRQVSTVPILMLTVRDARQGPGA